MWAAIVILLIIGILLILTELFFIPGTTIFGIAGLLLTIGGVVMAFVNFGTGTGWIVLGVTLAALLALLLISFRSNTWDKLSLTSPSTGRVNEEEENGLWKGDKGVALSALRPSGKAEFNDITVEVNTLGQYLEAGTKIRIIAIRDKRIFVEAAQQNSTT